MESNNHRKIYELEKEILKYLKEKWKSGYFPNYDNLKYDLKIIDVEHKGWFTRAIENLCCHKYIQILFSMDGDIKIFMGENPIPEDYNFSLHHYNIARKGGEVDL